MHPDHGWKQQTCLFPFHEFNIESRLSYLTCHSNNDDVFVSCIQDDQPGRRFAPVVSAKGNDNRTISPERYAFITQILS